MKNSKKVLSAVIAASMVFSMTAMAYAGTSEEAAEAETTVAEAAETEAAAEEATEAETAAEEATEAAAETETSSEAAENEEETTTEATEGVITIDDYSVIEIVKSDVEITDDEMQQVLDMVVEENTTEEYVYEGTVELGDTVNIDYSGTLVGEEDPFDGGTAEGVDVELGSGTMIAGFEEAIAGHDVGESFDITVTFPEDYDEDLAGKDAVFAITINYIVVTVVPELTDEMVKQYSEAYLEKTTDTIDDFKAYVKEIIENNKLESAIFARIKELSHIESFDSELKGRLIEYYTEEIEYTASNYGTDADTVAMISGYDTANDYAVAKTEDFLTTYMIVEQVCADKGIDLTDEEIDNGLQEYMDQSGYSSYFSSVDEFKEAVGDDFMLQYKTSLKAEKFMEALKEHVSYVEE